MEEKMRTGFIGLGVMGSPMCKNLIKNSGMEVAVYDINPDAVEEAVKAGAVAADSTKQIGETCNVIFTMLPGDRHVEEVYRELFAQKPAKRIYVDMSTISPEVSRKLAAKAGQRGEAMLDAPVVKSRRAAETADLGIYAGGNEEVYKKMRPLLECMGSSVLYLGKNGAGLVMKLCHNMLVGQIQNGVNEMLTLAGKAGDIDCETFAAAVACGGGKNLYLESKIDNLKNRDYTAAFAVEYMHKDVHLAQQLCRRNDMEPEGVSLVVRRYDEAMKMGLGKEDFSSTIRLLEMQEV